MMMALHFTETVPFKDVYVHALVRDEKGQKMSKSKGNVIDPIVLMDQYGADSLRMTLCSMAAQGRDIKLSTQRVEGYRNFITKIWNAIKFFEMNECHYSNFNVEECKNDFNIWILKQLDQCENETKNALESYRFNEAANSLYKFIWNIFCDWYIELSKTILSDTDHEDRAETQNVAAYVLKNIMIMLHPIMPFVTEHVWGQIDFINQNNSNKVIHANWPQIVKSKKDENGNINKLIEIISSIRSTRSELNVPPKAMIEIIYDDTQTHLNTIFNQYGSALESIAKIKSVNDFKGDRSEGDIQIIHENETFYLKLLNIIDFKVESIRLKKNLSKVSSEIEKIRIKLESKNFIENAPEDIIKEQKDRLDEYLSSKLKIEDAINSFSR